MIRVCGVVRTRGVTSLLGDQVVASVRRIARRWSCNDAHLGLLWSQMVAGRYRCVNVMMLRCCCCCLHVLVVLFSLSQQKLEEAVQLTVGNEGYMLFSYDKVSTRLS